MPEKKIRYEKEPPGSFFSAIELESINKKYVDKQIVNPGIYVKYKQMKQFLTNCLLMMLTGNDTFESQTKRMCTNEIKMEGGISCEKKVEAGEKPLAAIFVDAASYNLHFGI